MSIWSTDVGLPRTWPEWFLEYRRTIDAELHEKIAARLRGEVTEDEFRAWALENAQQHAQWVRDLPPDRRAWIEAQEEADRHIVLPPGTAVVPSYVPDLFKH